MKVNWIKETLTIGILLIAISCNQNESTLGSVGALKKANDYVASVNNCRLTSEIESNDSGNISLSIETDYTSELFPGKVAYDFLVASDKYNLELTKLEITSKNVSIYNFPRNELNSIVSIINSLNTEVVKILPTDPERVYSVLDSNIQNTFSKNVFIQEMDKLNLENFEFLGFRLKDSLLVVNFINSENQLEIITDKNKTDSINILGFHIK